MADKCSCGESINTCKVHMIQGERGPKGDKGDKGDRGEQGERGFRGEGGVSGVGRRIKGTGEKWVKEVLVVKVVLVVNELTLKGFYRMNVNYQQQIML